MKNAIAITAASVFLVLVAAAISTMFYFTLLEQPYLTYENLPFPTTVESVKQGEIIPVRVIRCNSDSTTHSFALSNSLYNIDTGQYTLLPGFSIMIAPGCTDAISRINRMPTDLLPGRYKLFGTAEIRGKIRTFIVDWNSAPFNVLSAK